MLKRKDNKFVVSIGDEGAVVSYISGNTLKRRLFITSPSSSELMGCVRRDPSAPIYILVDIVDQAYIQHTLPPVGRFSVQKLLQRKLNKDFNELDIKSYMLLEKEKEGKRELQYLLISVRNVPPFSEWIQAIIDMPNPLGGIYLLPIESTDFILDLEKKLVEKSEEKKYKPATWKILVSHHRVGGFRQVVYKNHKAIFTRIAQPIGDQTPDVVAGNIEQETLNTLEYVRRLGFSDDNDVDIFVIASREVKAALEFKNVQREPFVLTPHEIADMFQWRDAAEKRDRYGDITLAMHFASMSKHLLPVYTEETRKFSLLQKGNTWSKIAAGFVGGILLLSSVYHVFAGYSAAQQNIQLQAQVVDLEQKKVEIEKLWENFSEDPKKISAFIQLDQKIVGRKEVLFDFIELFAQRLQEEGSSVLVEDYQVNIAENDKEELALTASLQVVLEGSESLSSDQKLDETTAFSKKALEAFPDHNVDIQGGLTSSNVQLFDDENPEGRNMPLAFTIKISTKSKKDRG